MKRLVLSLAFAFAALALAPQLASAQNHQSGVAVVPYQSDPTGIACTSASPLIAYASNFYNCQASAYALFGSAFTTPFQLNYDATHKAMTVGASTISFYSSNNGFSYSGIDSTGNYAGTEVIDSASLWSLSDATWAPLGLLMENVFPIAWSSTGFYNGPLDTGLSRVSAGVVGVGNGTQGSVGGTLAALNISLTGTDPGLTMDGTSGSAPSIKFKLNGGLSSGIFSNFNSVTGFTFWSYGLSAPMLVLDAAAGTATMPSATLSGGVQPACAAGNRGQFWYAPGAAGVKDTVAVCAKDASDAYAFRTIY